MRISVITNWAYGITVVLTVLSGGAFILSGDSADKERLAVQQRLDLDELGDELALGADERTDAVRLYVMTGDSLHLDQFKGIEDQERRREAAIRNIRALGVSPIEISTIGEVEANAGALDEIEEAAVVAYQGGDHDGAQQTLFGTKHDHFHGALMNAVTRFRDLVDARTSAALDAARARADLWGTIAKSMLGLTAVLFIGVLYFVLRRRVAIPLVRMTGIVSRLARQDYAVEVPLDRRQDEIGEMNQAIHVFRENGMERERLDAERRRDQQIKDLILQMMHRLQACQAQPELAEVVSLFAPQIFPQFSGRLYIMNESRTVLSSVSAWLEPEHSEASFPANACWGIRRGRPHVSDIRQSDIPCQHLDGSHAAGLCVPLTAQGDTIGLLYFEERAGAETAADTSRLYLELIAENIGLAVANLHLRDKLTHLAVRDALTGLFNRRSLDEALLLHGRERGEQALACVMIDIDHFKRFNDEFGHDAGDEVMRYVAQILSDTVGRAGNVYRFGGEEFTVLLPDMDEAAAFVLAETIRINVMETPLSHRGRILGAMSISLGLAVAPGGAGGGSVATLVTRADAALLEAKSRGRNRTVRATDMLASVEPARRLV